MFLKETEKRELCRLDSIPTKELTLLVGKKWGDAGDVLVFCPTS